MNTTQTAIKIAYIEIDTHAEVAGNFKKLLDSSQSILVDYYFSDKVLELLAEKTSNNVFCVSSDNLFEKMKGQHYDLVILGTLHRYFNTFLKIVEYFPTIVIAHNLNFVKASNVKLLCNIFKKDCRFRLKLLLKEGLLYKNKTYSKTKAIAVLDKNLTMNGQNYHLPLLFNEHCKIHQQDGIFRVVIPGLVSQDRRDYAMIINDLSTLHVKQNLEIVFLGKVQGKELEHVMDLEKKIQSNIKIKYFTEKIPQHIYDKWIIDANVLWCPIQYKTEFFSVEEIYGKTKMSGNIGDAIRYAKNAIFPKHYDSDYFFVDNQSQNMMDILKKTYQIDIKNWECFRKEQVLLDLEQIIFNFVKIYRDS